MQFATRALLRTIAAGLIGAGIVLSSAAQNSGAVATVDRLHGALLDIMQNAQSLGYAGRRDRIAPVVRETFDLSFIARFALGRYWPELSPEERDTFVDVFSRWTVAHYAARFNGYSGETFKVVSDEPSRRQRQLVRTVLDVPDDSTADVTLDYLLHEVDGKWRIINVIANGVSDLSLKRADYGAVMKTQGFNSLVEKLEGQVRELADSE